MGAEPLQHALLSARWWPLQERDEAGKLRAEIESIELCEISSVPTFFRGERAVEARNSDLNSLKVA